MRKANGRATRRSGLLFTACAAACFAAVAWPTRPAQATTIALTVDATTTLAESDSGDDLATVRGLFQGAHAPTDFALLGPIEPVIADLKMKRMRILQADVYSDLDQAGNFMPTQPGVWDNLTSHIDWAVQHGLSPHFPVAYFMPQSFTAYGPAETWPSAIMDRYKSYARQLVRYVLKRSFDGGAPRVIFEVGNEMDIANDVPLNYYAWLAWANQCNSGCSKSDNPVIMGYPPLGPWGRALWWPDPSTYNISFDGIWGSNGYPFIGDARRVTRALAPMQKIYADAIGDALADAAFMADFPGKTAAVAGPALAGNSFQDLVAHSDRPPLEERFLDHMFDQNTAAGQYNIAKLDYFSFHYYGDFQNGFLGPTTSLKYQTDRIRQKLAALGHPETKLFVSEWGPSNDYTTDINYSHKGAAWAAAFLIEAVKAKIALGSYLCYDDAVGAVSTGSLPEPCLTHKLNGAYLPKPPANVFKMFTMMTGTRRVVAGLSGDNPSLGAFAVSDGNSAGIIAFNYNAAFADTADTAQSFSVRLEQLPFASSSVSVKRYLVDAQTSNLAAYLNAPSHPDPNLQLVEQFTALVDDDGTLMLPARTLGLGVSLWQVTR